MNWKEYKDKLLKLSLPRTTEATELNSVYLNVGYEETKLRYLNVFCGFDNINLNDYGTTDLTSPTRSRSLVTVFLSNEAKHFFFNRIVNILNSLPAQLVNSDTIESLKKNRW